MAGYPLSKGEGRKAQKEFSMKPSRFTDSQRPTHSLVWKSDGAPQLLEAGFVADWVPAGFRIEGNDPVGALLVCEFQLIQGLIFFS